jgi:hydroxymethylpyrimidine/phosphomethylpyrimidine kinase
VYGFAITTANTIQTENQFLSIQWTDIFVLRSIEELFKNYPIKAVKIGIVPSLAYLQEIVLALKGFRQNKDVWDTVLKSSTEYDFSISKIKRFGKILKNIDLITPNYHEIIPSPAEKHRKNAISILCYFTKGGHHPEKVSILYTKRDHPVFTQKIIAQKNMVQVVFYRLLLFLTLL